MPDRKWISIYDYYSNGPTEIAQADPGDAIACKVVAVIGGGGDWAAYWGPPGETNEWIASHGDKISQEAAEGLFPTFRHMGLRYRH